jgi:uncharacterized iron-regulated protein
MRCEVRSAGLFLALLAVLLAPRAASPQSSQFVPRTSDLAPPSYTPHRVYDTRKKQFIDFEAFVERLTTRDLVFVGEQHDDPATHRMELAILEGIARRRDSVVLALEMFERDVQPLLDRYTSGSVGEDSLLAGGRPWKNYATDYRPLVELARERKWRVIASNVPRPLASLVSRTGLAGLDTLPADRRATVARQLHCPEDNYYEKFVAAMGDMGSHGPGNGGDDAKARMARMYQSQCVKDETMGESVAAAWQSGRLIVHYNGAFHSDFGLGTAERARRRLDKPRIAVVTAVPVENLDRVKPSKEDRKRADYLLYVLAPAKSR